MKILNSVLKLVTAILVAIGGFMLLGAVGSLELDYISIPECMSQAFWSGLLILLAYIIHKLRVFFIVDYIYDKYFYNDNYDWDVYNHR